MTSTQPSTPRQALGVDVGGSGVKGALVDLETGKLVGERFRLETPQPATPSAVTEVVAAVVAHFDWDGPLGVTYPGVVVDGVVQTAANVDRDWIGVNAAEAYSKAMGAARSPSSTTPMPPDSPSSTTAPDATAVVWSCC